MQTIYLYTVASFVFGLLRPPMTNQKCRVFANRAVKLIATFFIFFQSAGPVRSDKRTSAVEILSCYVETSSVAISNIP